MKVKAQAILFVIMMTLSYCCSALESAQPILPSSEVLTLIQANRDNPETLAKLLPIVSHPIKSSHYEQILMTQLRDQKTDTKNFRELSKKIGTLLVNKVVECLAAKNVNINTPVSRFQGLELNGNIELVSIMRSGDALVDTFINHFPKAKVSKILVQRDEKTAKPNFQYMKLTPTIAQGNQIIITEPMIATGGSLDMAISLLKEKGVKEENILVASICAAPEGLLHLNTKFPKIKIVMTALDEKLNDKKYIVPGLGDFGDRYFGTH